MFSASWLSENITCIILENSRVADISRLWYACQYTSVVCALAVKGATPRALVLVTFAAQHRFRQLPVSRDHLDMETHVCPSDSKVCG